jgi:hypothetical protein
MLNPRLAPGVFDEDTPHCLGSGGKEVATAIEVRQLARWRRPIRYKPQVSFMH